MVFKVGLSGNPMGRQKGTRSYCTEKFEAAKACRDVGVNPFEVLAEMAAQTKHPKNRIAASAHLAKYLAPQLKAVEHSVSKESPFNMLFDLGGGKLNGAEPKK